MAKLTRQRRRRRNGSGGRCPWSPPTWTWSRTGSEARAETSPQTSSGWNGGVGSAAWDDASIAHCFVFVLLQDVRRHGNRWETERQYHISSFTFCFPSLVHTSTNFNLRQQSFESITRLGKKRLASHPSRALVTTVAELAVLPERKRGCPRIRNSPSLHRLSYSTMETITCPRARVSRRACSLSGLCCCRCCMGHLLSLY